MFPLLISLALANPFALIINGQELNEWAPIVYDIQSKSLIIQDSACEWRGIYRDGFENDDKLSVFFKTSGEFYNTRGSIIYYLTEKTIVLDTELDLECAQIKIFKDGLEWKRYWPYLLM